MSWSVPLAACAAACMSTATLVLVMLHSGESLAIKACVIATTALAWSAVILALKFGRRPSDNPLRESLGMHWNDDIKQDSLVFGTPDGGLTPTSEQWFLRQEALAPRDCDPEAPTGRMFGDTMLQLYSDPEVLARDANELRARAIEDCASAVALKGGFKPRDADKFVVVTQRPKYGGSITAFCSVGIVTGMTPEEGQNFMSSDQLDIRLKWDNNCASATVLEGPSDVPGGWGQYWCFHNSQHPYLGGLVGARDFLTLNIKWTDEATGAMWHASRSIAHHPRHHKDSSKKLIRSQIYICVFCFEPHYASSNGEPAVKITYLSCIDLKMSSLLRRPVESGMVEEQKRLFGVFRDRGAKNAKKSCGAQAEC